MVAFCKFASFNAWPGSMTKLFTGQPLLEEHLQTRYHQGNLWRRSGAGAHRQGQLTMHSGCSCLSDSSNIALRLRALCSPQRWEPAAWRPQAIQSLIAALQTCAEECSTAEFCLGPGTTCPARETAAGAAIYPCRPSPPPGPLLPHPHPHPPFPPLFLPFPPSRCLTLPSSHPLPTLPARPPAALLCARALPRRRAADGGGGRVGQDGADG